MAISLREKLDKDEEIIWMRLPSRDKWGRMLGGIQIVGHALLTIVSIAFAYWTPVGLPLQILLGVILIAATNAPLVAWGSYRLPQIRGGGDSIYFITNKRVGMLRPGGELRQVPICPDLKMESKAGVFQLKLGGEGNPLSFGGLRRDELLLVSSVTEGLVKKARTAEEDADNGGESRNHPREAD